jgi:hypothetical protein
LNLQACVIETLPDHSSTLFSKRVISWSYDAIKKDTGSKLLLHLPGKLIWSVMVLSLSLIINIAFLEVPEPNIPDEKINEEDERVFKN